MRKFRNKYGEIWELDGLNHTGEVATLRRTVAGRLAKQHVFAADLFNNSALWHEVDKEAVDPTVVEVVLENGFKIFVSFADFRSYDWTKSAHRFLY